MNRHPALPASVYRVHSGREAEEDYQRAVPGIARAFMAELIGVTPLWIRALGPVGLPRNYFITKPAARLDRRITR